MVPRTHKLSPLSRKMYNVFLFLSQMSLRNMDRMPSATHLFDAPLADVLRICGAEHQHSSARKYLAEMRKADVVWDSPDSGAELQHIGYALLSESRITRRSSGAMWVHWALPPALYEALVDPDRWASIDLVVLSRLQTYAAIVLYEICSKYRDNPSRVTCRRDPTWWTELLSATPFPLDEASGKRKVPEWRRFKSKFIKSAIDQINTESDLQVELLEDKEGGKSAKTIQFRVCVKRSERQAEPAEEGAVPEPGVMKFAGSLGINDPQTVATMTKTHGRDAVVEALQKLDHRQRQLSLDLVRSPKNYLNSILNGQGQIGENPLTPPSAQVNEKGADTPAPAKFAPPVAPVTPEMAAAAARREEVFLEIKSLSLEDQQHWLKAYEAVVRAKGMMTASIERRIASEDWDSGIVKSGVVDFYGSTKYGADWLKVAEALTS
jgi:hypothetical protein